MARSIDTGTSHKNWADHTNYAHECSGLLWTTVGGTVAGIVETAGCTDGAAKNVFSRLSETGSGRETLSAGVGDVEMSEALVV